MTTERKIIKTKVGLLELAKQLGSVSRACRIMGYSRDSFYRFKELYDAGGRGRPAGDQSAQADPEEPAVVALALEQPAWGRCGWRTNCGVGR
jgi:hypothetical protein